MIDEKYYGEGLIKDTIEKLKDNKWKKYYPEEWHEDNEMVEFSKGNRDYLSGFKPEYSGYEEVPIILSLNYKIKHKKGSLIITDYSYDLPHDEKWKKFRYVCNKETGLVFHRGSHC